MFGMVAVGFCSYWGLAAAGDAGAAAAAGSDRCWF